VDEAAHPGYVVDAKLSLQPLEVQPRLRGTNEPLGLSITHHPATPLLLPTCTGTYLAAQVYEQRVPGKSNGGHSSISTMAPKSYRGEESLRKSKIWNRWKVC
jgi:hypothetical protein